MSLVDTVKTAIIDELDRVSLEIEGEMKAIVSSHTRTGLALGAIHIEHESEFTRFVGGTDGTGTGYTGTDHLAMLDDGNGGGIIRSTRRYDRLGREPGKLWLRDGSFRPYVRSYDGIHFTKTIASKHGG